MKPKRIVFEPFEEAIDFEGSPTVLELAIRHELPLNHSCGGMGTCGTCCVFVVSNIEDLPPRNSVESEMADDRGLGPEERLACQIRARDGLRVRIP